MNPYETLQKFIQQIDHLTLDEQLELMDYLENKIQKQRLSAEAKAALRLEDEQDESQWITVIDSMDDIDEEALNLWLASHV
jgi:hypothetical protein